MPHIFISYSHKDSDYAHQLEQKLEQVGLSVWIDKRIAPSSIWSKDIEENLDSCTLFIVIMTPSAYESTWVQNELNRAQRMGKPIFPLLLDGTGPWLSVESIQYTDVRDGNLPPDHFFESVKQTYTVADSTVKANTKIEPEGKARLFIQSHQLVTRRRILVAVLFSLAIMVIWNVVILKSQVNSNADFIAPVVGMVSILVTGSGVSREGKKHAQKMPQVAVAPFHLAPSFESGTYGGLIGGAIAGLIIGGLYYADNPDAGWTVVPQVFIYATVAGMILGAATQFTILMFRHLVSQRHWSSVVFNEVTGGVFGGAVMGIPVGVLCGWQFFPHTTSMVRPDLLVSGAIIGAIIIVLGALFYDYAGRLRYVMRAFLTAVIITAFVNMLGILTLQTLFGSMLRSGFFQQCIGSDASGVLVIDATWICYPGLGALIGLAVGGILGLQIGLTLFLYRLWEAVK